MEDVQKSEPFGKTRNYTGAGGGSGIRSVKSEGKVWEKEIRDS